jgi:hypothetical protein
MSAKGRTSGFLAGLVTVAALAVPLTAVPAQAGSWVDEPERSCRGVRTVQQATVGGRIVELRAGTCNGATYVWGRLRHARLGDYIRFEVDVDRDRVPDHDSLRSARAFGHTPGYRRKQGHAYRACVVTDLTSRCRPANSTAWW